MNASNFTSIMISSDDNNDWKMFLALNLAREVQFIRDCIFYRYLQDTAFLDGRSTFNFSRGLIFLGEDGSFEHNHYDVCLNLRGTS